MTFDLPAPAKLNLFLHVTGRRDDGYHLLQTVFQLLDVGDQLTFSPNESIEIEMPGLAVPDEENLVWRAARALQAETGIRSGAKITIDKQIPAGGGLGGGSSDAATALHGLNHLWNLGLDVGKLAEIGLSLGADVPVFVRGESAWAEGVGDELTPVLLPEATYVIVNPGVTVPTVEIFRHPELTRDTPISTIARFLRQPSPSFGRNDLETVARALYPEVGEALDWLGQKGAAKMSGSGASVFCPVADRSAGERVLDELPATWTGFVAAGVNVSPLQAQLSTL